MKPHNRTTTKPRVLALAHLKGGTGATTVAVNLAAGLALKRRRVVLVDLDPVAAATYHLARAVDGLTVADVLDNRATLADVLTATALPRLTVAPAAMALMAWDKRPERCPLELARLLGQVPAGVDVVLLDLPPSTGALVRGALVTLPGGEVLCPVQTRALDLVGFAELVRLVTELAEQNPALHLAGVVPVRTNKGALSRDVLAALKAQHGRLVLPAIRESAAVAKAPLKHLPLALAAPHAPALADFEALTNAVLNQGGSRHAT